MFVWILKYLKFSIVFLVNVGRIDFFVFSKVLIDIDVGNWVLGIFSFGLIGIFVFNVCFLLL